MKKLALISAHILLLLLVACAPVEKQATLGIISAVDSQSLSPGVLGFGAEQKSGYGLAESAQNNAMLFRYKPESSLPDEVQVTVRGLVEDTSQPAMALIGASTNASTTRMAALSNFFNVPMVIPSAIGDNLLPSSNLWAFRLSAPGSTHAAHLFGTLLTRQTLADLTTGDEFAVPLSLGILYEQNTFGEGTAVETAKAAMAQEIEIGFYGHFDPDAPDKARLIQALTAMQQAKVHLVYIVASNPATAQVIVRAARDFFAVGEAPILLGQSGGFASREFLQSPEAADVYIIRQQIVPDRCPDGVETLAEAQSYAAAYLLNYAVEQSRDELSTKENPTMLDRRGAVRDSLKRTSLNLPCLGQTAFDNTGQNKNLQFEFLYAESGVPRLSKAEKLLEAISTKLNRDPFE